MSRRPPTTRTGALLALVLFAAASGAGVSGDGAADLFAAPAAPFCSGDPQARLDAVADLLIDGRPADASAAAEELLAEGHLSPHAEARARQLLARALERLPTPEPAPPPPPPPFPTATFRVRLAEIGGGFSAGGSGSLHLSEEGIAFVERGRTEAGWFVPWGRVLDLAPADGLWDAAQPLVLRQRGGDPHLLALIDGQGDDLPADRLLASFDRARREAERRRAASATEDIAHSPRKEQKR